MTGLIAGWGRWYSSSIPYRLQTDAFLKGRIALSNSTADVLHDFAWAEGGVQQVWGVGVPAIRMPFECLARVLGQPAFPDRLVILVALLLFHLFGISVILRPREASSFQAWLSTMVSHPLRIAAFISLAFFPSIVTFCMGAFNVYEEAVLASYIACSSLLLALVSFTRTPTAGMFLGICLCSGLVPLIRATAGCYGFAAVVIASATAIDFWGWRRALIGLVLFVVGGGVVFVSNVMRFGSGLEFGHLLNLSGKDLTYMSRMGSPFDLQPITSALLELVGSIFGGPRLNGFDCYANDIVAFQAPTLRWRHFYNYTFDLSHLLMVAAITWWFARTKATIRRPWKYPRSPLSVGVIWAFIAMAGLTAFYVRFHAMSSRYVMDYAPAIAGLICTAIMQLDIDILGDSRRRAFLLIVGGFCLWCFGQLEIGSRDLQATPVLALEEVLAKMPTFGEQSQSIPTVYDRPGGLHSPLRPEPFIQGWHVDGGTEPLIVLYVKGLETLMLDVEPADGSRVEGNDYKAIKARVGLEVLALESSVRTTRGRRLIFSRPRCSRYANGVHTLFVAMSPPNDILRARSKFCLNRVDTRYVALD